jgi:hypothetical protein
MYKVEVFKIVEDKQELFFHLTYEENSDIVMHNVPSKLVNSWERFGIPKGPGKVVKPEDGLAFLKAVARDFNGSMVRSNDVVEEK